MSLTLTNSSTEQVIGTYSLVEGGTAPPFRGSCPG
jgi:hypothetical protein